MKSSLKKLRSLTTHHRTGSKNKMDRCNNPAQLVELEQASQDLQEMRDCYDSLLSAAAATTNSAYEFSEALREMGACLLERTAMNDDEEIGSVLLSLGKVQFELQKLVDSYRSHIVQTITTPSESLLNELRTVEDMKKQSDEKRLLLEHMLLSSQKEKGKSKSIKGETFSLEQIKSAQEEYDDEVTLFIFRLKSLKQGQSRSLLTQAARHHTAQLTFFHKGNKSLEAIEPHVKRVAEQQHIDYQFSGLDDDGTEDDDYGRNSNGDGELSFDYAQNEDEQEVSTSRNSMELDPMEYTSPWVLTPETLQENLENSQGNLFILSKPRRSSQSAPIFSEKTFDLADKPDTQPSLTKKFRTYVLPTPHDGKGSNSLSSGSTPVAHHKSLGRWSHSSPLVPDKNSADSRDDHSLFTEHFMKARSVPKESDIYSETRVPPPLAEGLVCHGFDNKKKRYTPSGPLTSKAWSGKHFSSMPQEHTPVVSTSTTGIPTSKASTSPKVSPCTSSPVLSSTRTSLHELPRPPQAKPTRPPGLVGHSAPLFSRGLEIHPTTKSLPVSSHVAAPLPIPPGTMPRSFSIPSPGQRTKYETVGKLFETHSLNVAGRLSSHSVMPISLSNFLPTPSNSVLGAQTARVKGLS